MAAPPEELTCRPRRLGAAGVESLSGHFARQSAHIATLAGVFVKQALDGVVQHRKPLSRSKVVVNTGAGTRNGCEALAREVEEYSA